MDGLIAVCAAIAIIGTIVLYFYAQALVPQVIAIAEIDIVQPGSYVTIAGAIEKVVEKEKIYTIEVCDPSACTKVNILKSLARNVFLLEGNEIVVHGVVRDYAGRRYIEIKRSADIKILS